MDLLRADKVCLTRFLDTDTLASANGPFSAHLLPVLPAQKAVAVPDPRPALPEPGRAQPGRSSRLPGALHGCGELVGHCPQYLVSCSCSWLSQGVPGGVGFGIPMAESRFFVCP